MKRRKKQPLSGTGEYKGYFKMSKVEVELERCPFCGSEPKITEDDGFYEISCPECGCSTDRDRLLLKVIEAWNRRLGKRLLSCPFCGGNAQRMEMGSEEGCRYVVRCLECNNASKFSYSEKEVIDAWNRRA